jgi:hypothetical protein
LLAACQSPITMPEIRTVDTFCQNYHPIRASHQDTPDTIRQINAMNARYDELCR